MVLHQREQLSAVPPALYPAARIGLHRGASGVGLEAAAPPTEAACAADLHDGVADLAGRTTTVPGPAVEDQTAADAGPPEDTQQRAVGTSGSELELGPGRHRDVVAQPDPRLQLALQRRPGRTRHPSRAGCGRSRRGRRGRRRLPASRRRCRQRRGRHAGLGSGLTQRGDHRRRNVGRPTGRRVTARAAATTCPAASTSAAWISCHQDRCRRAARRRRSSRGPHRPTLVGARPETGRIHADRLACGRAGRVQRNDRRAREDPRRAAHSAARRNHGGGPVGPRPRPPDSPPRAPRPRLPPRLASSRHRHRAGRMPRARRRGRASPRAVPPPRERPRSACHLG